MSPFVFDSEPQSLCYIETANLDGETNLKIRQALPATSSLLTATALSDLHGVLQCDLPNRNLYEFNGTLKLPKYEPLSLGTHLPLTFKPFSLPSFHFVYYIKLLLMFCMSC